MNFEHNATILFAALLCEALLGYPNRLFAAIGHPVTWVGGLLARLDGALNRESWSDAARRGAGTLALIILVIVAGEFGYALQVGGRALGVVGLPLTALLAST